MFRILAAIFFEPFMFLCGVRKFFDILSFAVTPRNLTHTKKMCNIPTIGLVFELGNSFPKKDSLPSCPGDDLRIRSGVPFTLFVGG